VCGAVFVDSTTVRGNAAKAALIPRLAVLDHLDEVFCSEKPTDAPGETESRDLRGRPCRVTQTLDLSCPKTSSPAPGEYGTKSHAQPKISDHTVNRTGPTPAWPDTSRNSGWATRSTMWSGGTAGDLTVLVAGRRMRQPADARPLWHTSFRWKLRHRHRGYGLRNHPQRESRQAGRDQGACRSSTWGRIPSSTRRRLRSESDVYTCPAGQILRNMGRSGN